MEGICEPSWAQSDYKNKWVFNLGCLRVQTGVSVFKEPVMKGHFIWDIEVPKARFYLYSNLSIII